MKQFSKTFFRVFIIITLILSIISVGVLAGALFGYMKTNDIFDFSSLKMNFSSIVVYKDEANNKYSEFEKLYGDENRIWVDIENIPEDMQNAFIAIEDERFLSHGGVDIKRTAGAALNYIFKGSSSYGGSTITQQLVKNITGDDDVNPVRKIMEMWRAMYIERRYEKSDILEMYLNTIYLGQGCNGVQAASNIYFGKPVKDLDLAECACIAGITQYPSKYDPIINPEENKKKQEIVLGKMLELEMISEEEHKNAVSKKLVFARSAGDDNRVVHSYFVDHLIDDVVDDLVNQKGYSKTFATKLVYTGGLTIYSTVDPSVQSAVTNVYQNAANFPNIGGKTKPQGAMVIMDPYTGEIKGLAGGIGKKTGSRTLNRATQTLRAPGSTIKPLSVYAPALEKGVINPNTIIEDEKITIGSWSPVNYYDGYKGPMTVRRAVELSTNTVAVRVLQKVGVDYSFDFITNRLGISSLVAGEKRSDGLTYTDKNFSALALGGTTDGVSVLEMAAAYSTFVNKGKYTPPHSYTKIVDRNGKIILEKKYKSTVAMKESTAGQMISMLKSVVQSGTGTAARLSSGMPAAGKTGTTDENYDRWFIGCTPYYVGACWYGYDLQQTVNLSVNPNVGPWKKVMETIHRGKKIRDFSGLDLVPAIVDVEAAPSANPNEYSICIDSGLLASDACVSDPMGNRVKSQIFEGTDAPTEHCSLPHNEESIPPEQIVGPDVNNGGETDLEPTHPPEIPVQTNAPTE